MAPLYGFINLENLFDRRIEDVGVDVVANAIDASVAEHNRQMNALMSLFATPTTEYKVRFKTSSAARLQPLDEQGRARPIRPTGHYDVAFPIQAAGSAWGQTYLSRVKMTVGEANEATATLVSADFRWMRDHILAAMYADSSWTFSDEEHGDLTIKGMANGDSDVYLIQAGQDEPATDDHFLAQANAIGDAADNPFPTIYDELVEHPENSGEVIVLTPTNQKSAIESLTNFKEPLDPNLRPGANTEVLVADLNVLVPGKVIGYVDKCWIVEWKSMPDDVLIGITTAGDPPLRMRQHPEAELQGFNRRAERNDHPFYESQYDRYAGFGAWNRVAAVVYEIGAASYSGAPTGYASPMA